MKSYLRSFASREAAGQITKVALVGVANTVLDFAVFNVLRSGGMSRFWSITLALLTATFVSYVLNRRWTFALAHGQGSMRETLQFYAINLAAWAVTLGVVAAADSLFGPLTQLGENVAKLAAVVIILLPKFAGYRDVVFRKAIDDREAGRPGVVVGRDG
jgi:putative flippase GtrA